MLVSFRNYDRNKDYDRVSDFLVNTYNPSHDHVNWLQPRWEYMHYHPYITKVDLSRIGIFEAYEGIAGVVHMEHGCGTAYFQINPDLIFIKSLLLDKAEEFLPAETDGRKTLRIYINDRDDEFQTIAKDRGYAMQETGHEPMSTLEITENLSVPELPDGFHVISLDEDNDIYKIKRLMYRGFNHGDEPEDKNTDDQAFMQSAPNFRKDLNIVVVAPDGHYVSYCGMWIDNVNKAAYVEPVCTDPDYRRMKLASVATLEGVRRCGELGATTAYVGTNLPVYLSMGFKQIFNRSAWLKEW